MPIIGVGTKADPRRPSYRDTHLAGLSWSMMDYGNEPLAIVGVKDIPPATHIALAAETDVLALPENLDTELGAQLTAVQNAMEARNIPSGWVQAGMTYRTIVRMVVQAAAFLQRLQATTSTRLLGSGVTLDTQFSALPVAMRNAMVSAATSLGYDTTGLSGANTLRTILKNVADQWRQGQIFLCGEAV